MSIISSKKIKWTLFSLLMIVVLAGGLFIWVRGEAAQKRVNTGLFGSVAIKGYDTVAYHTESQALKGKSEYSYEWNDAIWHFSSATTRDLFAANPERYAPQYNGFCASSITAGGFLSAIAKTTSMIDPEAWRIIDGKLFLNFSKGLMDKWSENTAANISKADQNWAKTMGHN